MTGPSSEGRHTFVAAEDAPRLDVLVASHLDLSRNSAATLIANGRVLVDGRRERASYKARAGEQVVVDIPPPQGREVVAEDIPIRVTGLHGFPPPPVGWTDHDARTGTA